LPSRRSPSLVDENFAHGSLSTRLQFFGGISSLILMLEARLSRLYLANIALPNRRCSQIHETIRVTNSGADTHFYIDEGYSMIRTEAPKDLEGRGLVNLARTTPELPVSILD
jgi:hypothetical protein